MTRYNFVTFTVSRSRVVIILAGAGCADESLAKIEEASQLLWPEHMRVICRETDGGEAECIGANEEILSIINGCPMEHLRSLATGEIAA